MKYFTQDYLNFFMELAANNHKNWFDENRTRYHKSIKKPFEVFVTAVINEMRKSNPAINLEYKDCIFRINRDIRFSKDKTPYKLNRSAIVNVGGKKDKTAPGLYFELTPEHVRVYSGVYGLDKNELQAVREEISENLKEFNSIVSNKNFKETFGEVNGEKNKRIPKEFVEAGEKQPLIFNKQFYIYTTLPAETILEDNLLEQIISKYKVAEPFAKFLEKPIMNLRN